MSKVVAMPADRTISVDVTSAQVEEFNIGDQVEIAVRGEVEELTAGTPPEGDFDGFPPSMRVKVSEMKSRKSQENDFSLLSRDSDEE